MMYSHKITLINGEIWTVHLPKEILEFSEFQGNLFYRIVDKNKAFIIPLSSVLTVESEKINEN